ncbi:MAG: hypothetical protein KBB91_00400 [Candidatus Pacebacteria bacterium]|nr:hypothetical protein [Candidatus Paceibacterota bacterium]MBP9700869.1 hypothetical protein [Candidatus Paceibacterota bacterium]
MSTVKVPNQVMSVDEFVTTYLSETKGWQTAFKNLPSSGKFKEPNEKEKLILLSYSMNGGYNKFLEEVFTLAGAGRSTTITNEYSKYTFDFEEPKQQSPVAQITATPVRSTKEGSRERRKIIQAIQTELYRMIGMSKSSGTIRDDIKNHRNNELKDYKKMVFALIDGADDDTKGAIDELSTNETFAPLFGKTPENEISLSREYKAAAELLTTRYQKSLFAEPGTISDKKISDSFKDKVLNSVAAEIAKVFEEPVNEVKVQIEPEYADALEDVKTLIFEKK